MGLLENVVFKNQELENERLELTDKNSLYYLSTGLILRNCTIVLKVPASRLIINQAHFINCTFEVKQELKNYQQWVFASLKGCRFKGRFSGNDFGHWPDYAQGAEYGAIEDCDFSEARLDGCRFIGCDPRTLRFPRWPCFTFLEPFRHISNLRRVKWPGWFGDIAVKNLQKDPPGTVAVTFHAPSAVKLYKATAEELRPVIEQLDCIFY
jgi:uncharacterized protein YjbI with pentapeptide repeats